MSDAANLAPAFGAAVSTVIVATASAVEAKVKAESGQAFFGAARIRANC